MQPLTQLDIQSLILGGAIGLVVMLVIMLVISKLMLSARKQAWDERFDTQNEKLSEVSKNLEREQHESAQLKSECQHLQTLQHELDLKRARLEERLTYLEPLLKTAVSEKHLLERKLEESAFQLADRCEVVAELETRLTAERDAQAEKLKTLEQAKEQLKQEFQNLANRIFDEKTQRFSEKSKENLGTLLNPLKEQLGDFKRRVEDVYDKETKDRQALYEQIGHLKQLNQQMSEDTINLTNALKGENKTQGNWGEVVLERALEESGLRKGHEFELQVSVSQEGKRYQPDAIIRLPDGKDIIVDSKVSLKAYEQYCSTEEADVTTKQRLLREHLMSMRGHIKGLSDKAYQALDGVGSLDFVLLFIPVEGAFLLALEKEPDLFKEAFDRNIMLVSPSTLMVTLRTIHNIWRYEHQNQNAKEIAKRGGELHDKFVGFVESIDEIGRNLHRTQDAFDTAHKRLTSGRGNLVNQVGMLKKLGADGKKQMDSGLLEKAAETDQ
jgi:DNA recombination protein RmuC